MRRSRATESRTDIPTDEDIPPVFVQKKSPPVSVPTQKKRKAPKNPPTKQRYTYTMRELLNLSDDSDPSAGAARAGGSGRNDGKRQDGE